MLASIGNMIKRKPKSANVAKNRLQLVLARERVGIPESRLTQLRGELCEVISKYFEIDSESLEIDILDKNGKSALTVNTAFNHPVR